MTATFLIHNAEVDKFSPEFIKCVNSQTADCFTPLHTAMPNKKTPRYLIVFFLIQTTALACLKNSSLCSNIAVSIKSQLQTKSKYLKHNAFSMHFPCIPQFSIRNAMHIPCIAKIHHSPFIMQCLL